MMAEIKVLIVGDNDTEEELQVVTVFSSNEERRALFRGSRCPFNAAAALVLASTDQWGLADPVLPVGLGSCWLCSCH